MSLQHILYLTHTPGLPVALIIIKELLCRGHRVTLISPTHPAIKSTTTRFRAGLSRSHSLRFNTLGDTEEASPPSSPGSSVSLEKVPGAQQHHREHTPDADEAEELAALGPRLQLLHLQASILNLKPSLTIVDATYTLGFDAIRGLKLDWVLLDNISGLPQAPTSAAALTDQSPPATPTTPVDAGKTDAGPGLWGTLKAILSTTAADDSSAVVPKKDPRALNKQGTVYAHLDDHLKAILVLVPPGLHLHPGADSFDQRCFFVGPVVPQEDTDGFADTAEMRFLDAAYAAGAEVVYIDLTRDGLPDRSACEAVLQGLNRFSKMHPEMRFMVKGAQEDCGSGSTLALASSMLGERLLVIRKEKLDLITILKDPALKLVVHAGRCFGEALAAELPQLLVPSELRGREHELGLLADKYGFGAHCLLQGSAGTATAATVFCGQLDAMLEPGAYEAFKKEAGHRALRSRLAGGASACADIVENVVGLE